MKRISFILFLFVAMMTANLHAQTPKEVVDRMNAEIQKGDTQGLSFDFDIHIPILGEFKSTNYVLGNKLRMEINTKDTRNTTWNDGTTEWEYDHTKNEIKISPVDKDGIDDNAGNTQLVKGVAEGYDLSFDKKTDDNTWYIICKKNKSNKDKDDPKRIELAVSKADYSTVYMRTKKNGIRISMENFKIGVDEAFVTFNPADYPDAKIIDER